MSEEETDYEKETDAMKELKEIKWDALLLAAFDILLGTVVLIFPETTARTLGYLVGVVLILAGAVSMICYLLRDAHQNYYHNDFLSGLVEIALGCLVLYKVDWIISIVPFIMGLLVLISGCSKLQDVIDMKRMGYGSWTGMLILAIVNVALGVVLMANPFEAAALLFRLMGLALIFSGVTDCVIIFYFAKKIKEYFREIRRAEKLLEENFREERENERQED